MWKFIRRALFLLLLVAVFMAIGMARYGWKPLGKDFDYEKILGILPDALRGMDSEGIVPDKEQEPSPPSDLPTEQERRALDRLLEEKGG